MIDLSILDIHYGDNYIYIYVYVNFVARSKAGDVFL